jgi:hypothetical protein
MTPSGVAKKETDMKKAYLVLIVLTAVLTTACASRPAKTDASESAPVTKQAPVKTAPAKAAPAEGAIVGKPAAGSKFAQLKIGMTLGQVEKLIGKPTKQWQHPTGKASIPFYFGPDRWVIKYSYKGEGVLTLNSGGDQVLTQIEVNKAE